MKMTLPWERLKEAVYTSQRVGTALTHRWYVSQQRWSTAWANVEAKSRNIHALNNVGPGAMPP